MIDGVVKQNKIFFLEIVIVALVVTMAVLCRWISRTATNMFVGQLAHFIRITLYIGLFVVWGVMIWQRVIQIQVRRQLVTVVVLIIGWSLLRLFRWSLILNYDVRRWLWYLYYIPITMIPLIAFFVSMSLGKSEDYRLPRWSFLLYIPTILLILTVLTNDLHSRFFIFFGEADQGEKHYQYGILYYILSAWVILCVVAALVMMFKRCSIPRTGSFLWLPLIPFGVALIYFVLYAMRNSFVTKILVDFTAFECLVYTSFFESCMQCGLIPVNTRYKDLFQASLDISVQITDYNYVVRYSAHSAETIKPQIMASAEKEPVILPEGKRLHNISVNGGHAIWTEDISELLKIREDLENVREELSDRREIIRMEYVHERERKTVEEQNRLYDLMQRKTQQQFDRIRELAAEYRKTESSSEKNRILASIVVLGSFIKRRRDFVLTREGASVLSDNMLSNAFQESFRSLKLLGIEGTFFVRSEISNHYGEVLATAYDFFEDILESVMETSRYLNVHVSEVGGLLRCSVETDGPSDVDEIRKKYPSVRIEADEDGSIFVLPLVGGAEL